MSYRELKVGKENWRFKIGTKFTEVRSPNDEKFIHENSKIGSPRADGKGVIVTPLNVNRAIRGLGIPEFTCEKHGTKTKKLAVDPYDSEINGIKRYVPDCEECLLNRKEEI